MAFESLLTVVAELLARPGKETQLEQRLLALLDPTLKEPGCVQYDLHRHISQPGRFVFYEKWESQDLLNRHLQSPHLKAFVADAQELLAEPLRVELYEQFIPTSH